MGDWKSSPKLSSLHHYREETDQLCAKTPSKKCKYYFHHMVARLSIFYCTVVLVELVTLTVAFVTALYRSLAL
jgi:hypothetical protein